MTMRFHWGLGIGHSYSHKRDIPSQKYSVSPTGKEPGVAEAAAEETEAVEVAKAAGVVEATGAAGVAEAAAGVAQVASAASAAEAAAAAAAGAAETAGATEAAAGVAGAAAAGAAFQDIVAPIATNEQDIICDKVCEEPEETELEDQDVDSGDDYEGAEVDSGDDYYDEDERDSHRDDEEELELYDTYETS